MTPANYAKQLDCTIRQLQYKNLTSIYTGQGYLDLCTSWPTSIDSYWWSAYPLSLYPSPAKEITWDQLKTMIDSTSWCWNEKYSPAFVKLWQASGDRLLVPGSSGHAIDLNIFRGTLDELKIWFGVSNSGSTINSDPIVEPITNNYLEYTVDINNLNVRNSPMITNNKIGVQLMKGQDVKIDKIEYVGDAWGRIADGQLKSNWIAIKNSGVVYLK